MKLLMMVVGLLNKEDYYNASDLPWIQVVWVLVSRRQRDEIYNIKPWW